MLISPAFKVVEHFQGPKGCFCACCKIQMWKSEVAQICIPVLAGSGWGGAGEPQSACGSASVHRVEKHLNVFSSSELTITCRGFLHF